MYIIESADKRYNMSLTQQRTIYKSLIYMTSSANTTVYTDLNKYNISNRENKYRPDVISHLQYHSCTHYPCTLTSVLYLTRPSGTPANGRKSGPNQEYARRPVWISLK